MGNRQRTLWHIAILLGLHGVAYVVLSAFYGASAETAASALYEQAGLTEEQYADVSKTISRYGRRILRAYFFSVVTVEVVVGCAFCLLARSMPADPSDHTAA